MVGKAFYQQIEAVSDSLPPVELWDPPLSGNMDCLIRRDGSWHIEGSRLENDRMIRLFSTVLKHEDDNYFLVTPAEKWHIEVEDLPFIVVELKITNKGRAEQLIQVRTNVGDWIMINAEHAVCASPIAGLPDRQAIPCVHIRAGLMARLNRSTFLEFAELLEPALGTDQYTFISAATSFSLNLEEQKDNV